MDDKGQFSTTRDPLSTDPKATSHVHREIRALMTRDHDVIKQWAERHSAQPATGEATATGPATVQVNDGGAGIRFNFPSAARFRAITWDEWFENFDRHGLTFVYEEEVADRAYEFYQKRGGEHGHDQDDWFEAERQMHKPGSLSARYRLIKE